MPGFTVPEERAVRVMPDVLTARVQRILEAEVVPAEDAELAADGLVLTDLRGVDTHGASNMLR